MELPGREGSHFSIWMELRSSRRLRRSPPPPPQHGAIAAGGAGGDDRISALPDDMLLQILVRLRCARAAARAGLLSRRWLGLWARLPGLTFRGVQAGKIEAALARVARRTAVSVIDIRLLESMGWDSCKLDDAHAKSLLRAAARLSPEELVFILPDCRMTKPGRPVTIVLPGFRRATSIELDACFLQIKLPPAGELPALEMLSISGNIVDLDGLLDRCPRLRVFRVTFCGVKPSSLELALAALQAATALGLVVSRLGIKFDDINGRQSIEYARFSSLLRAAARLSPQELFFQSYFREWTNADLLCFPCTTSIQMNLYRVCFTRLPADEFSVLERLSLGGCTLLNIVGMVSRCPRLRVLKVVADKSARDVTIHSASLQELVICVEEGSECRGIDIKTPLLKLLNLNVHGNTALSVSITAPQVEKVSWRRSYAKTPLMFGFWSLGMLRLETAVENYKCNDGVLSNEKEDAACSPHPHIHVLSLHVYDSYHLGVAMNLEQEMGKLPLTNFSALELHISPRGHAWGAFCWHLFGMSRIQTAMQNLKVILPWDEMSGARECVENCPCDEPKNWRSQNICLDNLAQVEIDNFRGGHRETDFLTLIFKWAPMLKRMTVRISPRIKQDKFKACAMDTHNIFSAYPSVSCSMFIGHTSVPSPCS